MVVPDLAGSTSYPDFFSRRVLLNVQYWCDYVGHKATDISALDAERERIVTAISFALDLTEAGPIVYDLIVAFSPFMERQGYWEIWHQFLNRAIEMTQSRDDLAGRTTLTALLARLLFQQHRFKESVSYYRQTIRLARQIGDSFNKARACSNLGYYYAEQGQWRRAEILCCYALQLFEQLGSNHGLAHTENHLGFLYSRQDRWDQAQQHLERACKIWQATGDAHGLMRGFLNLGLLHVDAERPGPALEYLEQALYQAQLTGENTVTGRIYLNMGLAYRLLEEWANAEAYTRQAEAIFQRYSSLAELARSWGVLGLIYFQQDRWAEADFYMKKSLALWRDLGMKFGEIEALMDMGECELARGDKFEATARLQEVEGLMGSGLEQGLYRHLQPRLARYRRQLQELLQGTNKICCSLTK